jgi:hypothetical protein
VDQLLTLEVPHRVSRFGLMSAGSYRTYCRAPRRGRGADVSSRRVPSDVSEPIVLADGELLDVASRLGILTSSGRIVDREIEIPELEVKFGRRANGGQNDMTTTGRPNEGVCNLVFKLADTGKVALLGVELVEIDIVLDDDTGNSLTIVGVVGRDDGKARSCRLPRKLGDVVLVLDNLDWIVFLSDTEQFQVAERRLL